MSLLFLYENTNNVSTSIGSNVIRFGALALTQSAQVGEPAISEIPWDDPDGTWDIIGYRQFWFYETAAASNNQLVAKGRVMSRTYSRGPFRTGAGRRITVEFADQNVLLGWRILFDGSGAGNANRPAETAGDRIRWLVNSRRAPIFAHPTYFANPTNAMDACDYRGQRYNDVLADIANTTGYNFWADYDEGRERTELFFMDPAGTDYTSTLSISNDLADVDSALVFAPSEDAELHRDPSRIAAGVYLAYDGGAIYQTRDSIGNQFAFVDQSAPLANVKSAAKARAIATRYQDDNDEEDDTLSCSIVVPAASVNLIRPGMRMQCKFTHLPGYTAYRYLRVLKRTVIQEEALGQSYYRIVLDLSGPGTAAPQACTVLGRSLVDLGTQFTFSATNTASGFYPPSSTYGTNGDFVGGDTTGRVFYMSDGGGGIRARPVQGNSTDGRFGGWTAAYYGLAKSGMPTGFADGGGGPNVGNPKLEIMVLGAGTLTVYTSQTVGSTWTLYKVDTTSVIPAAFGVEFTVIASGSTGDPSTTVTVPSDGYCLHVFVCTDNSAYVNPALGLFYGGHTWVAAS